MREQNASITKVDLGFHDGYGSIPNAWIWLDYGGSGQSFGGYALGGDFTHHFVYGVLDALKAESWEKLVGMPCRVRLSGDGGWNGKIVAIGHFTLDRWYDPTTYKKAVK